jgi:hypothetical protein
LKAKELRQNNCHRLLDDKNAFGIFWLLFDDEPFADGYYKIDKVKAQQLLK